MGSFAPFPDHAGGIVASFAPIPADLRALASFALFSLGWAAPWLHSSRPFQLYEPDEPPFWQNWVRSLESHSPFRCHLGRIGFVRTVFHVPNPYRLARLPLDEHHTSSPPCKQCADKQS